MNQIESCSVRKTADQLMAEVENLWAEWTSMSLSGSVAREALGEIVTDWLKADQSETVSAPTQIIDPPGAAVEMFRRKHGRLPTRPGDQLDLADRLELAAQACRAAHLLSCEATCRDAIAALRQKS